MSLCSRHLIVCKYFYWSKPCGTRSGTHTHTHTHTHTRRHDLRRRTRRWRGELGQNIQPIPRCGAVQPHARGGTCLHHTPSTAYDGHVFCTGSLRFIASEEPLYMCWVTKLFTKEGFWYPIFLCFYFNCFWRNGVPKNLLASK